MAMESNIYAHYMAKQSAQGTPAGSPTKRTVMVAGDFNPQRDDGSEVYSDLQFFPTQSDWVNTLIGNGNPGLEATPGELAYLLWLFFGGETATGGTNTVQTISITGAPTGGTFTLTISFRGATYTTAPIAYNAAAAAVTSAIEAALAAAGMPAGVAPATGGPLPATPVVVTFSSAMANQAVPVMTASSAGLTGGASPTAAVALTTPGTPVTHATKPLATRGFWSTHWLRVGATQIRRQQFNDCMISNLQIEGSTSNKAVRATPTIVSLDPGQVYTADPTNPLPYDSRPFLFTEGASSYTVDGVVLTGTSQFSIQMELNLQPLYGDNVTAVDLVPGNAAINVAVSLRLDANGLNQYNKLIYGTASPANGAKPIKSLPPLGAWSANLVKDTNTSFQVNVPGVKWGGNVALPPNPAGGPVDLSLAGQMRLVGGQDIIDLTVKNSDAAYTV